MKFVTKELIVVFLICISLFSHIANATTLSSRSKSKTITKTKGLYTFTKRILKGMGDVLFGGKEAVKDQFFSMLGCFDEKQKELRQKQLNENPHELFTKSYKSIDYALDKMAKFINYFFSLPRYLLNYLCKFRKNMVLWIAKKFSEDKIKKFRQMTEEGRSLSLSQLRRMKLHKGFFDDVGSLWKGAKKYGGKLYSGVKTLGRYGLIGLKYIGGKAWDLAKKVIYPFILRNFEKIKNFIFSIRDSFFGPESFLGRLVDCARKTSKKLIDSLKSFWNKLRERYNKYKGIWGLGIPYVILYGADMIFAGLCEQETAEKLVAFSKKAIEADKSKDLKVEIINDGKVFGTLIDFQNRHKSSFEEIIKEELKKKEIKVQKERSRSEF